MSFDIKQKKIFYINSRNRISGTHSNFTYEIDTKQFEPDFCTVLAINIPKTYYMVQDGENTMTLTENSVETTITFTPGNYNRTNLKSIFQNLLNNNTSQGWSYVVSKAASNAVDTGKYTFTVTGNSGLQPSFTFGDGKLHEMLGFDENTVNTFSGDTLTSVNVIKIQKEDSLFVRSDITGNHSVQILQEVYSHVSSDFDHIDLIVPDPLIYAKHINNHHTNIYRFQLTDENGKEINLNGNNWTMTLCLFKLDYTSDNINKYIKSKHTINKNNYIF